MTRLIKCAARSSSKVIPAAISLLVLLGLQSTPATGEQDMIDFGDQATSECRLIGLQAPAPAGWFTVPISDLPDGMAGCQMMRTDRDDNLVGLIRLSASDTGARAPGEESRNRQVAIELEVLAAMGIKPRDRLWSRDDVPVSGPESSGFSSAQAVGLSAVIEETGLAQELHFLTFHGPSTQYALLLITPPPSTEPDIHQRNVGDFGRVIQGLKRASTND